MDCGAGWGVAIAGAGEAGADEGLAKEDVGLTCRRDDSGVATAPRGFSSEVPGGTTGAETASDPPAA